MIKRLRLMWAMGLVLIGIVSGSVCDLAPCSAVADDRIHVAVVAGFIMPFQEIAAVFEEKTGVKVDVSFSSAGRLYGQIINGAPYDMFLSADRERPDLLHSQGLCEKPFMYALGDLVLWSADASFCGADNWRFALGQKGAKKVGIVNPLTGVHGERAMKALQDAGLWNDVLPGLVYAPDMAQVFQWATEHAVVASFCSRALAYTEKGGDGCFYEVQEASSVIYSACLIRGASNSEAARDFAVFLLAEEAEAIKRKYGYGQAPSADE